MQASDFFRATDARREEDYIRRHKATLTRIRAEVEAEQLREAEKAAYAEDARRFPPPPKRKVGQRKDYAPINDFVRDRIVAYRLDGAPVAMIANYLGVSKTSVRRVLKEMA